jgi:ssDNA-binding Zn-finger/Zn-ribbon topoisomerase 1
MMIRKGRRGPFLGCSGYPKCKNTGEVPAKLMEEMGLNGNGNGQAHEGNGATAKGKSSKKSKDEDEIETDLTVE